LAELDDVAARAVGAVAHEEQVDAAVVTFLLRRYFVSDAPEVRDALGPALALALALAASPDVTVVGRAAWLMLLVEATAVADDERIVPAVEQLVTALRREWPTQTAIDDASASVDACLRAAQVVGPELVQDAIDHLERVVGGSYRPGDGLVRDRGGIRVRCSVDDHVRGASALLTAFEVTGRLPYSMLAEELIAIAGRDRSADAAIVIQCEAARVLCRLASLHDDPDYRGAAVIATGADYRAEASRVLAAQSVPARAGAPSEAAAYGLALLDLLK
jgi:uncharacterized protein YyaL (SSP411 family)